MTAHSDDKLSKKQLIYSSAAFYTASSLPLRQVASKCLISETVGFSGVLDAAKEILIKFHHVSA